jgi:hypothetical protein
MNKEKHAQAYHGQMFKQPQHTQYEIIQNIDSKAQTLYPFPYR